MMRFTTKKVTLKNGKRHFLYQKTDKNGNVVDQKAFKTGNQARVHADRESKMYQARKSVVQKRTEKLGQQDLNQEVEKILEDKKVKRQKKKVKRKSSVS